MNFTIRRLYYCGLLTLAFFVDLFVQVRSRGRARFKITSNPLYDQIEVEGAKPLMLSDRWETIVQESWFQCIPALLKGVPLLGPLSILTFSEHEKIRGHYRSETFRFFKQLQRLGFAVQAVATGRASARRLHLLSGLLRSVGDRNSTEAIPWAAIESMMEKIARQNLKESGYAVVSSGPHFEKTIKYTNKAMNLDFLHHSHRAEVRGLRLSLPALEFWSRVLPETYASNPGSWLRSTGAQNENLDRLKNENAQGEKLLSDSERRVLGIPKEPFSESRRYDVKESDPLAPKPYCYRPFSDLHVTCEGDAYICCFMNRPDGKIGNLRTSTLPELWHSQVMNDTRDAISRGEFPRLCKESLGCPYYHQARRPGNWGALSKLPTYLELNLPNRHCNIGGNNPSAEQPACIMCERSLANYYFQDDSNFDEVLETIRQTIPSLDLIHIQGWAEPFWKDGIFKVLDRIDFDRCRDSLRVSMTTNATVFTPERQEKLMKRCPNLNVHISIDAATSNTYQKIRRVDMFETVLSNVRHWGQLRRKSPNIYFRIQNNINMLNVNEVVGMVRFAAEVGVNEIEFNPTAGDFDFVVSRQTAPIFAKAERHARAEADRLGVKLVFLRPLDLGLAPKENSAHSKASRESPVRKFQIEADGWE